MNGAKALIVFTLLTGIFAEQCDLKDLEIAEFSEHVTVTNVSPGTTALVWVKFNHGRTMFNIPGGTSRTAKGLLATQYDVYVLAPDAFGATLYRERLKEARDRLVMLSLDTDRPPEQVAAIAESLLTVVSALDQLSPDERTQTCSGKIEAGVDVHVTVEARDEAEELWVLSCG